MPDETYLGPTTLHEALQASGVAVSCPNGMYVAFTDEVTGFEWTPTERVRVRRLHARGIGFCSGTHLERYRARVTG